MSHTSVDPLAGVDGPPEVELAFLAVEGPAIEADHDLVVAEIDAMVNQYAPNTRYRVRQARRHARRAYVLTQVALLAAVSTLLTRPDYGEGPVR